MAPRPLLALLLAAACQAPHPGGTGFASTPELTTTAAATDDSSTGTPPAAASDTSTSDPPANTSTTEDSGAAETHDSIFDLGTRADSGSSSPAGCKGKIDLVFVISRESVMDEVQDRLIAAFPEFIATIQEKFADFDYHIMVVGGGDTWGLEQCNDECTPQGCPYIPDYPCDKLDLVTVCDNLLGAGTVFPAGSDASNKPCPVAGGKRFLTRDQPDPSGTFACIARVGLSGVTRLGEALTVSLSHQLAGPGGCNDDFLRDDALFMVTLIGPADLDEPKTGSSGTPDDWFKAVLDAKHGDPNSVVMLSLGHGDEGCQWWDRTCTLAKAFPYHHVAPIVSTDFGPAFDSATNLVEQACAGFVPPPG